MLQEILPAIVVLCVTALLLLWFSMGYAPQKRRARYLRRGLYGLLLLTLWNALMLPRLGVNPLSVLVTGALGLPGAGLMAVINLLP